MSSQTEFEGGHQAPEPGSVGRQGLITVLALIINGGCRVVISMLVGRVGGPASLGVFQSGAATAQLGNLFGPAAYGTAASKFLARLGPNANPASRANIEAHLLLRTCQTGLALGLLFGLGWALATGASGVAALSVGGLLVCLAGYSLARGALYGSGNVRRSATWEICTSLLGLMGFALAIHLGVRGPVLLLALAAGYGLYALINLPRRLPKHAGRSTSREVDVFGVFVVVGTLSSTGFLQLTMILAAAVGQTEAAGHFGAAFVLAGPAALVGSALGLVLFPLLSAAGMNLDGSSTRRLVDTSTRTLTVMVVPVFAVLILLRGQIVEAVWGSRFADATALLAPLLLAVMLTTLATPSVSSLTTASMRGVRLSAGSSVMGVFTGLIAWVALVPHWGLVGISIGYLVGTGVSSFVPFVLTWRSTGQRWGTFASRLVVAFLVLCALSWVQEIVGVGVAKERWLLIGFLVLWFLASRSDAGLMLRGARLMVLKR